MKLSVIIPCYNEAKHITQVLDAVAEVDIPKEIIVVDDGSTDNTREVLEEYAKTHDIIVHHSVLNYGKGAAIRMGLEYVTGDVIIIQDADLEYDPKEYPKILKPIIAGDASVVYGSRFLGEITGMKFANRLANRILTFTANVLFRARISDEATCYKAFRSEVLKGIPLTSTRFEFCPEVTAKLRKRGIEIREVPITYTARTTAEGKGIRWTDGFAAMWALIKYRFVD